MPERRSAVMIMADAWGEAPHGSLQKARVRIVNKSASGACIRSKSGIDVGTKLRIQSRWDEFSGVAKYCRSDGTEYLIGIQREASEYALANQAAAAVPNRNGRQQNQNPLLHPREASDTAPNRDEAQRHRNTWEQLREERARVAEIVAKAPRSERVAEVATEVLAPKVSYRRTTRRRREISQYLRLRSARWLQARAETLLQEREAQQERGKTPMDLNWMGRSKQGNTGEDASHNASPNSEDAHEKKAGPPMLAPVPKKDRVAPVDDGDLADQNELLPLEEIYVAAGVVNQRRGYTIKKVVEMLHSEHLSALSKEMRRASVMMALDAAGISVDEVLRDAQVRLETLNSYELEQKHTCEAEWARKAEEHVQLKAELEQVQTRYMERMKQKLDGIARDRARFATWLTMKQQEVQSITEAAELCLKVAPPAAAMAPAALAPAPSAATAPAEAKQPAVKVV